MRKNLFCLLLLVLSISFSAAQGGYQRYLSDDVVWFEYRSGPIFGGSYPCYLGGQFERFDRFHITIRDTFNNVAWYRVHMDWRYVETCYGGSSTTTNGSSGNGPAFLLREDSTGKLFYRQSNGGEYLLYDFGQPVLVGDTLELTYGYAGNCEVAMIDSVYLGADARARYWCDCQGYSTGFVPEYIIEGIGMSRGLTPPTAPCVEPFDLATTIVCYYIGGNSVLIDSIHACGVPPHLILSNAPEAVAGPVLRWSPGADVLSVKWPGSAGLVAYEIFSVNGQKLAAGQVESAEIQVGALPSGIYVIRLHKDGQSWARKFLKWD